jgi:hypothetical protein
VGGLKVFRVELPHHLDFDILNVIRAGVLLDQDPPGLLEQYPEDQRFLQ